MPLSNDRLRAVIAELVTRPGHNKVGALLYDLLVNGLGASSSEVDFERPLREVHGRADALLGRTVFEFKRDLRYEKKDAEEELARYLSQREAETGERFVGIATDGALFLPYELRSGALSALTPFAPSLTAPEALADWLDSAASLEAQLAPDLETVRRELGRTSLTYDVARSRLGALWAEVAEHPEVVLKRQLWADLLERVYGSSVDSDDLFFQHTFLTIIAKAMATSVLGVEPPSAIDLLSGQAFQDAGIDGAVESDFFDWVLVAPGGADVVSRIARQVTRFRLADVQVDVLKGLYESLIDPEQRHELGEYYTPDWLASRMCERLITDPLNQRVLDPACGSGTFLFHAVRRFLASADAAGLNEQESMSSCCSHVLGVDVHPVAVLIARVTYLLAFAERLPRHPKLSIPVYLGDSLQWNTSGFMADRVVLIEVPDGPILHFPASVATDPAFFDAVIETMTELSEADAGPEALAAWLRRTRPVDENDEISLADTYDKLRTLHREQRNHIWGYIARNLSRPVWLSSPYQQADIVIGNPPWLAFQYMALRMQEAFRSHCQRLGVWVGGRGRVSHQDLSAYFFARSAELYLRPGGMIGFVMPYAALSRGQFASFRSGWFGREKGTRRQELAATVKFLHAWTFDESVQPLFPVPSCVLIAAKLESGTLPTTVIAFSGALPRRDATPAEAEANLSTVERPWPAERQAAAASSYGQSFRQGAIIVPRVLFVVEEAPIGRVGGDPAAPLVQSRRTNQEKAPWRTVAALRGQVEKQFLRPVYLGESIAPYRLLQPSLAVIPWGEETNRLLPVEEARRQGYRDLARWLTQVEDLWKEYGKQPTAVVPRLDYYHQLSAQFPIPPVRVLYAASGTLPAAAILRDQTAVVEHKLYWAGFATEAEAYYLTAILNSETARAQVAHLQSRGQWGARDFDKVMFELPIPRFDPSKAQHKALSAVAKEAEVVAAHVDLDTAHFVAARRVIRRVLSEAGVAERMEGLVSELLGTVES